MGADWRRDRRDWRIRIKKLALSYETGWEYLPESQEPGSMLTDIFLDMELENQRRFGKVWEKQEREFLTAVPEGEEAPRRLETALWVKASGESDGRWLEADTPAYAVTAQGTLLGFHTLSPLRLTAARLRWIICRRGLLAWLCYQEGEEFPVSFSVSPDRILEHPVFLWRFRGLCDGHCSFSFGVECGESGLPDSPPAGRWTIGDGRRVYTGAWQQSAAGASLSGDCPEFAGNLEGTVYELRLEVPVEETLSEEWLRVLAGGITLREEAAAPAPELCLTETGPGDTCRVLPFGEEPETAACFYLACDRAVGGALAEAAETLTLQFTEEYETEEKNPDPEPEEYRKLYRKYPWLRRMEQIQEWQAAEALWEYFDGRLWRALPGSEDWNTGCRPEEPGERRHSFQIPRDMSPCSVEGEEHIYLRLRVLKAVGAYAPCYRKRIPVLKNLGFRTAERVFAPEDAEAPDIRKVGEKTLYLGFDREIQPENCWYTGRDRCRFQPEQIKGPGERFGKKACWVEIPVDEEELTAFLPNYAEVRQDTGVRQDTAAQQDAEGRQDTRMRQKAEVRQDTGMRQKTEGWQDTAAQQDAEPGQVPEGTAFYVETGEMGVLEAASVADARYDRAGAPIRDEKKAAEHFFSHFGRMLTIGDLDLLLGERYPSLKAEDCRFYPDQDQFQVRLSVSPRPENETEENGAKTGPKNDPGSGSEEIRLEEVEGWLTGAMRRMGPLWLQRAKVRCVLPEQQAGGGEGVGDVEAG